MRKIKYVVVPLIVCFVIALSPFCYAFATDDVSSPEISSDIEEWSVESPVTYSTRRTMTLNDDTSVVPSSYNYILNQHDIVNGVVDFDNFYTYWCESSPLERYKNHGNYPENLRLHSFLGHDESTALSSYYTSSLVLVKDSYYGTEVLDCDLIEWTVFWYFDVSKLNEFDDDTDYLFDFELLIYDDYYDSSLVKKLDNFFVIYSDGVTSGNDGLKCLSFSPSEYYRPFSNALVCHYRFTVSGKICNNIGRLGFQAYTDYYNRIAYGLNGDFTVRAYTDADKIYDLGADTPNIDNAGVNNDINNATAAQDDIMNEYSVDTAEVGELFSGADGLLNDSNYTAAISQVSTWIDTFVSQNNIIYLLIITALCISLCVYVIGRGFK